MKDVRLSAALVVTRTAGAGLMALRGTPMTGREAERYQLKTAADRAAEGWVLGYLRDVLPDDSFLSEEEFDDSSGKWEARDEFWTVDALDGTRSFAEGFDGFCVQVAFIVRGEVALGVIHEPVTGNSYWAARGEGAFVSAPGSKEARAIHVTSASGWPPAPLFVDSRPPKGPVGSAMKRRGASLLECGSFGLKFCRVAEGAAHVFAKDVPAAIWDAAPGSLIVSEAGGKVARWDGSPLRFAGDEIYYDDVLAAPADLFDLAAASLAGNDSPASNTT